MIVIILFFSFFFPFRNEFMTTKRKIQNSPKIKKRERKIGVYLNSSCEDSVNHVEIDDLQEKKMGQNHDFSSDLRDIEREDEP